MDALIPCAGSLAFIGLVFGFILVMRFLSYKETLALAEKGLVKPVKSGNGKGALIWGIIFSAVGVALMLGLWPLGFMFDPDWPLGFGPWMLAGLLPLFFGLALILIHVLTYEKKQDTEPSESQKSEQES